MLVSSRWPAIVPRKLVQVKRTGKAHGGFDNARRAAYHWLAIWRAFAACPLPAEFA